MVIIKQRGETIFLQISEIIYAEAAGNYTIFHTNSRGKIVASKCLKEFQVDGLVRVSQSILVNPNCIRTISGNYIDVGLKNFLKISRRMKRAALAAMFTLTFIVTSVAQDTTKIHWCDLGFITFLNDTLYHRNSINGEWSKTYLGDLKSKPIASNDLNVNEYPDFVFVSLKDSMIQPRHLDRNYLTGEVDGNPENELQALRWDAVGNRIGLIRVPAELNFGAERDPWDSLQTQWFPLPKSYSWLWDFVHETKINDFFAAYNSGNLFMDTLSNMIPGSVYIAQGTEFGPNIIKYEQGDGITFGYQNFPTLTYPYKTLRINANDSSPTNEINVLGGSYNPTTNILNITGTNGGGSINFDLSDLQDSFTENIWNERDTISFAVGSSGSDISVSGSPVTNGGTLTINIPTANGSTRGALSPADWTTFASKVGGSGTATRLAFWNSSSTLSSNANLFWDNTNNRLGIGNASPQYTLDITGGLAVSDFSGTAIGLLGKTAAGKLVNMTLGSGFSITSGVFNFAEGDASPTNEINVLGGSYNPTTNILNITGSNGGGSINFDLSDLKDSFTENIWNERDTIGLALGTSGSDVSVAGSPATNGGTITLNLPTASGSARGLLSSTDWTTFASKVGGSGTATRLAFWNSSSTLSSNANLFWDNTNNRLGIGNASPQYTLDITGGLAVSDLSGTAIGLLGKTAAGKLVNMTLGSGFSITSGVFNFAEGDASPTNELVIAFTNPSDNVLRITDAGGNKEVTAPNIYTVNGTLTGVRTLTQGTASLTFTGTNISTVFYPHASFPLFQNIVSQGGIDYYMSNTATEGIGFQAGNTNGFTLTNSDDKTAMYTSADGFGNVLEGFVITDSKTEQIYNDSKLLVNDAGVQLQINGSYGTSGYVIKSGGPGGSLYFDAASGGSGTVTSIGTGTGLTGGTITTSGTISITGQILALHNLGTTGIMVRTGSSAFATREIQAGTGISISSGTGVGGNIIIANTGDPDPSDDMALYNGSTSSNYNVLNTNGVWRGTGTLNGPSGTSHSTLLAAFQTDGNYGYQLASVGEDQLFVRNKTTTWGSWYQLASRSWVTSNVNSGSGASGYITKYTGSTTQGNSVLYESGSNIGVGTTVMDAKLHVSGSFKTTGQNTLTDLSGTGFRMVQVSSAGVLSATTAPPFDDVQTFASAGTWTKPAGCKTVTVTVIGGGGGGGGGSFIDNSAYNSGSGGGGGGAGGYSQVDFDCTNISSTVSISVGSGGSGGPAQSSLPANGNSGGSGSQSSFGSYLKAAGGSGGQGGQLASSSSGGDAGIGVTSSGGNGGGSNNTASSGSTGSAGVFASAGGNGGAGVTTSSGGANNSTVLPLLGNTGSTTRLGTGGSGGAAANIGGSGGSYGGGGGGGGAGRSASHIQGGAGGSGASGFVMVITHF